MRPSGVPPRRTPRDAPQIRAAPCRCRAALAPSSFDVASPATKAAGSSPCARAARAARARPRARAAYLSCVQGLLDTFKHISRAAKTVRHLSELATGSRTVMSASTLGRVPCLSGGHRLPHVWGAMKRNQSLEDLSMEPLLADRRPCDECVGKAVSVTPPVAVPNAPKHTKSKDRCVYSYGLRQGG